MPDPINKLERWRAANGLTQVEMVELIGANSKQQYYGWLKRGSLPKAYYRRAAEILGEQQEDMAPKPESYGDSAFARLNEARKLQVLREILPTLSGQGRSIALEMILELEQSS